MPAVSLMLAICAGCGAPVAKPGDTAPASDRPDRCVRCFRRLMRSKPGRTWPGAHPPVGDSHTANDAFSGRMRRLMQARFGDAGRGMLPPGIPFRLYRPAQVTVTADGWTTIGSLASIQPGAVRHQRRSPGHNGPRHNDAARRYGRTASMPWSSRLWLSLGAAPSRWPPARGRPRHCAPSDRARRRFG